MDPRPISVAAVGECTRDCYLDLGIERVGGISLNYGVGARRAGAGRVALVSAVGDDEAGRRVKALLVRAGIEADRVTVLPGPTASQEIRLSAGDRIFPPGGYRPGVLASRRLEAVDQALLAEFDVVAAPWCRELEHLFEPAMAAARPGATRVADLLDGADLGSDLERLASVLATVDLAFIGGTDHLVAALRRRGSSPVPVVVTLGAAGAVALIGDAVVTGAAVAVPTTEQVDSTGCGDAFQAAFTMEWLTSRDARRSLEAGARAAALVIRHIGAVEIR